MKYKTYHVITIGCQMNKSDSERISGFLEEREYCWSIDKYESDLVLINTCGVRESAENRIYGIIPRIKKVNPGSTIVITGCLSNRDDIKKKLNKYVDIWLPIKELPYLEFRILSHLTASGNLEFRNNIKDDNQRIKPKHTSAVNAYVPIGNGCNNYCSYCVVPFARGREQYRRAPEIIEEVKDLVSRGYKEINLIAQNVNSYNDGRRPPNSALHHGPPSRPSITAGERASGQANSGIYGFADLLLDVNNIDGKFWIRFATSHPKDMSDSLIKAVAQGVKVCEHIHLPVQSGDNDILKAMNRKYTREHYLGLIKKIRRAIPRVAITTDVIVGFPGETAGQFNNTMELFRQAKFDMAYIAQYSARPGTTAEKLDDNVPKSEKKQREKLLTEELRITARGNNNKYIGQEVTVLVQGRNKKGGWYGKTRSNKVVKWESNDKIKPGRFIQVQIMQALDFGLTGVMKTPREEPKALKKKW